MNEEFERLRAATPARLGVGRAGTRYTTRAQLDLRADHARAVDAVLTEIPADWPRRNGLAEFCNIARTREEYIRFPERGRRLTEGEAARLRRLIGKSARRAKDAPRTVLIAVGDGLSGAAVVANAKPLVRALVKSIGRRFRVLGPIFIRNARERIEDQLGAITGADIVCMIVGERPGLKTAESLSAYVIFRPTLKSIEPQRTVVSNIHAGGISVADGAAALVRLFADAIRFRATGAELAAALEAQSPRN